VNYWTWASLIVPRPIALVSTLSADGVPNIAPFSSLACISNDPPLIGLSFGAGRVDAKRTLTNILETGEFCANLVTTGLRPAMMEAAKTSPAGDDFLRLGLRAEPMETVSCSRIVQSPATVACKLLKTVDLSPADVTFVIARVVEVAIDDSFVRNGSFASYQANIIASTGVEDYITLQGEAFHLARTWD
jgi:flavin reductase (DIM6/NTAB) family NADH-FMN oxidoreductase RutF